MFIGLLEFLSEIGVPLFFALGVVIYVYALFNYFIIGEGAGEEDVKDSGRKQLIWACVCFVAGVALWLVLQGIWYVVNIEISIEDQQKVQVVPNIPKR